MAHCTLLNNFIQNHVFIDDDEEDQDDHSKIKGLLFTFSFFFFCEIIFRENFLRENDTTISRKNLGVVCLHIQFSNMAIYFLLLQNCTNVVIFWPVFLN